MDAEDRELFERSLAHVMSSASGAALDDALSELGWHDALASDRADAVALAFEQQGRAGATSGALGAVHQRSFPSSRSRRAMMLRWISALPP